MQINEVAVSGASIIPSEYTQLKLHMTSATEPEPYKITGTCDDYSVGLYGPFDDDNNFKSTCAKYPDIRINFGSKICIKGLNIRFQNGNITYFQYDFTIYGSNDGESWSMIDSVPVGTSYSTRYCELELLINNNTAYMYYRLYSPEMFLYDCYFYTGTPDPVLNYLLQTSDGIISLIDSNYNSETDTYNVLDSSITDYTSYYSNLYVKSPTTEVTINSNTFRPIDKIDTPFKLLLENSNSIAISGIPTAQLLITDNIDLTSYDVINNLSVDNSVGESNSINFIFSIDNGTTWKTYSDNAIANIDITIPDSNYSSDNKTIWDNAITSIKTNGILSTDISSISFNTLDMNSIKFAIVLSDVNSSQDCKISSISVNYTINDGYTEMNKDECKIEVTNNIPIVTSLISTNKILIDIYK